MPLWQIVMIALLPFIGNFGGGMLAERIEPTERRVSIALHGAAGIVFAVIGVELMPRTLENAQPWIVVLAFCLGGIASILTRRGVKRLQARRGGAGTGPWMIYIAVSTDLFADGLLIGTGSAVSFTLALLLAVAQVLADIPEGFATIANFRSRGLERRTSLLLSAGLAIPIMVATLGSYWLLRDASLAWQMAALAFTAGMLTVLAAEDILPEAHATAEDSSLAAAALLAGFALFTLLSAYVGG